MRMTFIAAAAGFAVASGAMIGQTSAADLDFAPAPAPEPFVPTWQGFYIGGHVGYGEADFEGRADVDYFDDADPADDEFLTFSSDLTADGLVGGAQAGYNWQAGSLVFGIEGDISFTDWDDSSVVFDEPLDDFGIEADAVGVVSADIDMLASVRGRIGYAMDTVMVYGTGGVAWADAEARGHVNLIDDAGDVETIGSVKESFNDVGFVVGGGMGWMVIPQTFSVGVEG
ncbi:MAG: outer membrane protein, partial [bacterium]